MRLLNSLLTLFKLLTLFRCHISVYKNLLLINSTLFFKTTHNNPQGFVFRYHHKVISSVRRHRKLLSCVKPEEVERRRRSVSLRMANNWFNSRTRCSSATNLSVVSKVLILITVYNSLIFLTMSGILNKLCLQGWQTKNLDSRHH